MKAFLRFFPDLFPTWPGQIWISISRFEIILNFSDDCMTIGGPNPNKHCIFPFQYHNKTFETCTYYYEINKAWCATKVDSSGNLDGDGQTNFGTCAPNCPMPSMYLFPLDFFKCKQ